MTDSVPDGEAFRSADDWDLGEPIEHDHPISRATLDFIAAVTSLRDAFAMLVAEVGNMHDEAAAGHAHLNEALRAEEMGLAEPLPPARHEMPLSKQTRYLRARRTFDSYRHLRRNMGGLLLMALVSHYDAFLARIVRSMYGIRSELKESINRQLTFSELRTLASLDDALELLVEREIGELLRKSHGDQLAWFEKQFNVPSFETEPCYGRFVELTERRNLIAHNGGLVNNRYVSVCKDVGVGVDVSWLHSTKELLVDGDYFEEAYRTTYEVGVRLALLAWRKVRADQLVPADRLLSRICYTLLVFEQWQLAQRLLGFAVGLPKHASDHEKRIFVINWAQSHKWAGDPSRCLEILGGYDWSASEDSLLLAVSVLRQDFGAGERFMKIVAESGDVPRPAFHDWPLFRQFRETPGFRDVYKTVFGEVFLP